MKKKHVAKLKKCGEVLYIGGQLYPCELFHGHGGGSHVHLGSAREWVVNKTGEVLSRHGQFYQKAERVTNYEYPELGE